MSKEEELYEAAVLHAANKLMQSKAFKESLITRLVKDPKIVAHTLKQIDVEEVSKQVTDYIVKDYVRTAWRGRTFVEMVQREAKKHVALKVQQQIAEDIQPAPSTAVTNDQRNTICEIKDCHKPAKATTYCYMHYKRLRRHGDPLKAMTFKERSRHAQEARRLKKLQSLEYEALESEPK